MKFSLFAMTAMVATAFAAPSVPTNTVNDAVEQLTDIVVDDLGVGELLSKRDEPIKDATGLINVLSTGLDSIKVTTGAINTTLAQVQSGAVSKDNGTATAGTQLTELHYKLTEILQKLLGAAGIDIQAADHDKVLGLIVELVSEVLYTVKALLTVLGVRKVLASILQSVFTLLAEILSALVSLIGTLVPALIAALSPLLSALGNTVLAPLLSIIADLLASLTGAK
ncbi:hypothetical protein VHEMI03023 [[Torrubiella] hemipterigena]|uniref:Uncharacterized protein n=1 Tax=[Torrubiella] hemipterigena TaxID=1531966 RepID=A0A0A1T9M4_9HYPO|nr:hypothetical protein VHEMI03023 [[Torrubiella] hemipterigena]